MNLVLEWKKTFEIYLSKEEFSDKSHDLAHFNRVWKTAKNILTSGADELVVLAACYFHDIVTYPKNHPNRSKSSYEAALKTKIILRELNFPKEKIESVCHCIEAHSFSANIRPKTVEAKIVQDSDRMESLGAIGLARTFYVAGQLGSNLFHSDDPFGEKRVLDDKKYALDHFKVKLLKLPDTMQTDFGKDEATKRAQVLLNFMAELENELV